MDVVELQQLAKFSGRVAQISDPRAPAKLRLPIAHDGEVDPSLRSLLIEVKRRLAQQEPIYQLFAQRPETFSTGYLALVEAGDNPGSISATFRELTRQLEQRIRSERNSVPTNWFWKGTPPLIH